MLKEEIIKRSPIRILEKSIQGGLGRGNLGVFAAKKGVGKTACLVHFATDHLLRGHKALHISFADNPHHIHNWYVQVYQEIARSSKLDAAMSIYEEIIRNRLILHFKRTDSALETVNTSINNLIHDSAFIPNVIIIDGFVFDEATADQMHFWKQLAEQHQVEMWFSATLSNGDPAIPYPYLPPPIDRLSSFFAVIIHLIAHPDYTELRLLKDHDAANPEKLHLRLDPKTLLIANLRV